MSHATSSESEPHQALHRHDSPAERGVDISFRRIIGITWPVMISQLSFTAMGILDTMMVGQLGVVTLAAVGLANFLVWWLFSFVWGMLTGINTLVAQAVGAGRDRDVGVAFWQGLYLGVGLVAAYVALIPAVPWLLAWTGASSAMLDIADDYMTWRLVGALALGVFLPADNFYRGLGETRLPMWCGLAQVALNCGFNYLLIFGKAGLPALGAVGAALGTGLAQFLVGFALLASILLRRRHAKYHLRAAWRPDAVVCRRLVVLSLPIGIQVFMEMGGVSVFSALVARLGEAQMAASNAVVQLWSIAFMVDLALAVAATTLVGQAIGAQRPELGRRAVARTLHIGWLLMALLAVLYLGFPQQLMSLFVEPGSEAALMPFARPLFVIVVCCLGFDLVFNVYSGALRGAGDTRYPMLVNIGVAWLVFVPLAWWASGRWGVVGAWACFIVHMSLMALLIALRFRGDRWIRPALAAADAEADEGGAAHPPSQTLEPLEPKEAAA